MSDIHGRFVWYELMTSDKAAAQAFYGKVVGWGLQVASPAPDISYSMFTANETPVAGMVELDEKARKLGAVPSWIGYVGVDDVDASVAEAKKLGGTVQVAPTDIPNVGRFAVLLDPQRTAFSLFKWANPMPPPAGGMTPGHISWHELLAADWPTAFDFYSRMFGWTKAEAVDIGAMGTYQLFAAGGQSLGGIFNKPPMLPAPLWLYYFNVGDIDAAAGRVTEAGGKVMMGPMEVPGGGWILQGMDPQGAAFALFGKRA